MSKKCDADYISEDLYRLGRQVKTYVIVDCIDCEDEEDRHFPVEFLVMYS
jgi:hypothetical protein